MDKIVYATSTICLTTILSGLIWSINKTQVAYSFQKYDYIMKTIENPKCKPELNEQIELITYRENMLYNIQYFAGFTFFLSFYLNLRSGN